MIGGVLAPEEAVRTGGGAGLIRAIEAVAVVIVYAGGRECCWGGVRGVAEDAF